MKEHRKKVKEKNAKKPKKIDIIERIIKDESPNKMSAYYSMKAITSNGTEKSDLSTLSKKDIHFLLHVFGMKFKESLKKKDLVTALVERLNNIQSIPYPERCSRTEYETVSILTNNTSCKTCSTILSSIGQQSTRVADQNTDARLTHEQWPRRKQFRPTKDQEEILKKDHEDGLKTT